MMRHAGHGDAGRALRQRQTQGLVQGDGIFIEGLVEVAHAKEQHAPRMLGLEASKLTHGRGVA